MKGSERGQGVTETADGRGTIGLRDDRDEKMPEPSKKRPDRNLLPLWPPPVLSVPGVDGNRFLFLQEQPGLSWIPGKGERHARFKIGRSASRGSFDKESAGSGSIETSRCKKEAGKLLRRAVT